MTMTESETTAWQNYDKAMDRAVGAEAALARAELRADELQRRIDDGLVLLGAMSPSGHASRRTVRRVIRILTGRPDNSGDDDDG